MKVKTLKFINFACPVDKILFIRFYHDDNPTTRLRDERLIEIAFLCSHKIKYHKISCGVDAEETSDLFNALYNKLEKLGWGKDG